jgi:L-ascorbate metabolism protein UlaG (beta-lactamase superfamily)
MLSAKGSLPPVILTANKFKNPLTDLPINLDSIVKYVDFLLLTHLHFDHFDKKAIKILLKNTPVLCSKIDSCKLKGLGFSSIHAIQNDYEVDGIKIIRYPAIHGQGLLKYLMGKGSSYLLNYQECKIFLTGDCIWTESLKNRITADEPDIIIANAGAASFKIGKPITMSVNDIKEMAQLFNKSKILVVHLDALNHCSETGNFSKIQTQNYSNIHVPNEGEIIVFRR